MNSSVSKNRIVLLGVGHTNAHVVWNWMMGNRPPNVELVCVSSFPVATYSGMLPAVIAGDCPRSGMEIDLVRLAKKAGCRLIIDEVKGVDRNRRQLLFENRAPLEYDYLSIGIGSEPSFEGTVLINNNRVVTIKPMQTFLDRLSGALSNCLPPSNDSILRVVIVGGGVASAEVACCLNARFNQTSSAFVDPLKSAMEKFSRISTTIISSDLTIGRGLGDSAQRKLDEALRVAKVETITSRKVTQVDGAQLTLDDASHLDGDVIIWATHAVASKLLRDIDLEHDDRGFLQTKKDLTTTLDRHIFAVGDSGTIKDVAIPKAGVYAVRQGPFLFRNLLLSLERTKLVEYLPQTGFLKLINLGNEQAIGELRGLSFKGHSVWVKKKQIDTRFMKMYQDYDPAKTPMQDRVEIAPVEMRCVGCGGKVASEVLHELLASSQFTEGPNSSVVLGLQSADDAAILRVPEKEVTVTTDYFAAPLDDPFLFGRIVAIHSTSDLFAMGAKPFAALANIEIPFGSQQGQRRLLMELMSGIVRELKLTSASLVGGHTIEGPRMAAGLTVFGSQRGSPTFKGNAEVGDQLILTKPLGTGIAFVSLMNNQLSGQDYCELIRVLLQGNDIALPLIEAFSLRAMTDVTGFGLLGHLREMLTPKHLAAKIYLEEIPVLPFIEKHTRNSVESTLAPSNQNAAFSFGLAGKTSVWKSKVLFDPQTCGGLLIASKPSQTKEVLSYLTQHGFSSSSVIGEILPSDTKNPRIELV